MAVAPHAVLAQGHQMQPAVLTTAFNQCLQLPLLAVSPPPAITHGGPVLRRRAWPAIAISASTSGYRSSARTPKGRQRKTDHAGC